MLKCLSRVVLFSLIAAGVPAMAQSSAPPTSGLGQAWPNAPDISSSTHFHVYAFDRGGIRYIQVNDLNGNVLGAVAWANGEYLVLPMGQARVVAASYVKSAITAATATSAAASETVYQAQGIQISASSSSTPSSGPTTINVDTCDPVECNGHITNPN